MIASGADLNVMEPGDKYTPLLTAIMNDNLDFATLLIEKGAKVDDGSWRWWSDAQRAGS